MSNLIKIKYVNKTRTESLNACNAMLKATYSRAGEKTTFNMYFNVVQNKQETIEKYYALLKKHKPEFKFDYIVTNVTIGPTDFANFEIIVDKASGMNTKAFWITWLLCRYASERYKIVDKFLELMDEYPNEDFNKLFVIAHAVNQMNNPIRGLGNWGGFRVKKYRDSRSAAELLNKKHCNFNNYFSTPTARKHNDNFIKSKTVVQDYDNLFKR